MEKPTQRMSVLGAQLAASVVVSLLLAELGARALHHNAFPHLNLFVQSARFGVELEKDACTRLRSRLGHVTTVCTNHHGFRSPPPEALPKHGRVLLLGDSQVLGYGVEEPEAMAQQLTLQSGGRWQGMAAAVPSWGPTEFALAAEDLVPQWKPERVVFVAYVGNDWMEAPVPNARRTTALHGWTRRVLAGQDVEPASPLGDWLFGRSHLMHAAQTLWSVARAPAIPPADAALKLLKDVDSLDRPAGAFHSRISVHVARVVETCRQHGCQVLVAVLPMDVQGHAGEWAKYRTAPQDVVSLSRLAAGLVADGGALGVPVLDLLPALQGASPGAWLVDDDHLSPQGHAAVAAALDTALSNNLAQVEP